MNTALTQSVGTDTALIWSILSLAPIVITILVYLFVFRKMAYFKERNGLKWLATIGLFIALFIIKPFVIQIVMSGRDL